MTMTTTRIMTAGIAAAAALSGTQASAAVWRFELTGVLQSADGLTARGGDGTDLIEAQTAFTFTAVFDDAGPAYRAGPPGSPLPGYAAYAFRSATLSVNGVTYEVASFADDPVHGVAVALFDPSNVFNPGFYAAGFFGNPQGVGPGLVARFGGADGAWSAASPAEAALTGYLGYGAVSGPTADGGPGNRCQEGQADLCAVVPILLTGPDGTLYDLTLVSAAYDADGQYAFTASLAPVPVPAPGALVLLGTGLAAAGIARRRMA